jgi:TolB-like protein/Tfp pilus assembly protein PilF
MLGRQLGHFRIEGPLGAGGMGEVFRARDERLQREVAIKVLPDAVARDPDRLARFEREALALAQLSHPNILAIHEFGREGEIAYVVTELLHGETVRERTARERLPWRKAVEIAAGVADGLASAHSHGIVHRDLKPENLFLTSEGHPRILDFGIARFDPVPDSEAATLPAPAFATRPGMVVGTIGYLSPEQARGEPGDARSDIFALGGVLFEMLTGRRAFARDSVAQTLHAILSEPAPDISDLGLAIPPDVSRIVARCLEKDPEDRVQSARDLAFDLRASLTSAPSSVLEGAERSSRAGRWPGWAVSLAVMATALAFVTAGWIGMRHGMRRSSPAAAGEVGRIRIVVFPFENLGAADDSYFAAGMTEEVTSRLAGVRALAVASRTTAVEYDRRGKTLKQVGADLRVDFVLEGTVRWDRSQGGPGRVRITPQLIRTADDTHLWAATYEREMGDLFALQSDVAAEVVRALGQTLSPEDANAVGRVPTRDLAAYDLYLRASRIAVSSYGAQEGAESVRLLTEAVARDPGFAEAHALLARQHVSAYWFYQDRSSARLEKARLSAERAVALAPDNPETHLALGYYYYQGHLDYDRALAETRTALRLRPEYPEGIALQAFVHRRAGRVDDSARLLARVVAVDSGSADMWHNLAETYWLLRRYPEADRAFERALALNPRWGLEYSCRAEVHVCQSGDIGKAREMMARAQAGPDLLQADSVAERLVEFDFLERRYDQALARLRSLEIKAFSSQWSYAPLPFVAGVALHLKGDSRGARESYQLALKDVERELKERPDDPRLFSTLGRIHAGLGHRDEALRAARAAVDMMPISREAYRGAFRAEDLARVHALVGEPDTAIELLEGLLAMPSRLCASVVRLDPAWDALRSHPRFQALLRKHGVSP